MIEIGKLLELLAEHDKVNDTILEDNQIRINLIKEAFKKVKEEALKFNKANTRDINYVNLEKILDVCRKLSPTEGYWDVLIIKSLYCPNKMKRGEIFEIGRFIERMFQYSAVNEFYPSETLNYKQILQGNFR